LTDTLHLSASRHVQSFLNGRGEGLLGECCFYGSPYVPKSYDRMSSKSISSSVPSGERVCYFKQTATWHNAETNVTI